MRLNAFGEVLVLEIDGSLAGIVDGEISDKETLAKLAKLPSKDTLLTQLAGALIAIPKDLAISLDLYAKQKEEN